MAIAYAAATFAIGAYNAYNKRKGLYSNAKERDRAAKDSLLTAKYNINQNKIESRQTQFQVLETGGNITQDIAVAGLKAEGAAEVAGASSGATIDSGSPRAVLTSIVQEALQAQTNVVVDTRNRIRAIARDTENRNTEEWRNAKKNEKQQKRIANRERRSADKEFTADIIKTGVKSYAAGSSMSGTGDVSKWGAWGKKTKQTIDTASAINIASDARSATGGKGDASLAKSPYNQQGYSSTFKDRLKYGGYTTGERKFSWNSFKKGDWASAFEWLSDKETYKGGSKTKSYRFKQKKFINRRN